jgi:hypothetical protein
MVKQSVHERELQLASRLSPVIGGSTKACSILYMYANRLKSSPYFNEVFKAARIILSIFNYLFKCMITNKMVIFWVGLTVPIGPKRPKAFVDLG